MRAWSNLLFPFCRRALGARSDLIWLASRLSFWLLKLLNQSPSQPDSSVILGVCVVSCKWYETAIDDRHFWYEPKKNELDLTRFCTVKVLNSLQHQVWDAPEETEQERTFYHEWRHAVESLQTADFKAWRSHCLFRKPEGPSLFPGVQVEI
jgi:hypothetical protein